MSKVEAGVPSLGPSPFPPQRNDITKAKTAVLFTTKGACLETPSCTETPVLSSRISKLTPVCMEGPVSPVALTIPNTYVAAHSLTLAVSANTLWNVSVVTSKRGWGPMDGIFLCSMLQYIMLQIDIHVVDIAARDYTDHFCS